MRTLGADVRLILEDQGDGWFWNTQTIGVEVRSHTLCRSREYYRVAFDNPLELQEPGFPTPSGLGLVTYPGAWLSSRWKGKQINDRERTSVFFWLIRSDDQEDRPSVELSPTAWVMCQVAG